MAAEFNNRAAELNGLQAVLGPIIAGLTTGAPDCWPKINQAVNAIRIAANRAVNDSWNVVDEREATIHALTTQLDNCLSGSYFRQTEFQACTRELAAARADQAASTTLIAQLRSENGSMASALNQLKQEIPKLKKELNDKTKQVLEIPSLLKQCQDFWKAEKARQEAPLNQKIKDLGNTLEKWRNGFPGLGPLHASEQFKKCKDDLKKCHDLLAVIQPNDQQCQDKLRSCQTLLLQGQDRIKALQGEIQRCTDSVVLIRQQCQNQITNLQKQCHDQIVQLRQTIIVLEREKSACDTNYVILLQRYNQLHTIYVKCQNEITKCKQQTECKQCTTLTGKPGKCTGVCLEAKV